MFLTGVRCPRPPNWPYLVNFRCFGGLKKKKMPKEIKCTQKTSIYNTICPKNSFL